MNSYLQAVGKFLKDLEVRLEKLRERGKTVSKSLVFTLSSTSKGDPENKPYLTPVRENHREIISGAVVRTVDQGVLATRILDLRVDFLFIDVEEKKILFHEEDDFYRHFELVKPQGPSRSLFEACSGSLTQTKAFPYKPNDLTVESVWNLISAKVPTGREAALIGVGNIGFKLALKLVESHFNVRIYRRNKELGRLAEKAINIYKPLNSRFEVRMEDSPLEASRGADILVGTSDGTASIEADFLEVLNPGALLIDLGKGTFSKAAIESAIAKEMTIVRADITSGMEAFLAGFHRNQEILNHEMGRRRWFGNVFIASGGFLGKENDVIVNNYVHPQYVVGLCDGAGDIKRTLNADEEKLLSEIKNRIEIEYRHP